MMFRIKLLLAMARWGKLTPGEVEVIRLVSLKKVLSSPSTYELR